MHKGSSKDKPAMGRSRGSITATQHPPAFTISKLANRVHVKLDVSISFNLIWYHLLLSSFSFPITPDNLFSPLNLSKITIHLPPKSVLLLLWVRGMNTQVAQKHGEMREHNFHSSVLFSTEVEFVIAVDEHIIVPAFKKMYLEHIGTRKLLTYWEVVLWSFKNFIFF